MHRIGCAMAVLLAFGEPCVAGCKVSQIETDIEAVRLDDESSAERALGALDALPFAGDDMPSLLLFNGDRSEMATLTQFPGAMRGSFGVIEVRSAVGASRRPGKMLEAEHLSSEHGVKLGVSQQFVVDLLGLCFTPKKTKGGRMTIRYETDDPDHPFLKRTGLPNYFAEYTFRHDRLVAFRYGSDNP
ncbi:hypothetical protein [Methylosinus sp. Sm6]|uniref:hypothetical protein n=1 Tax=Methylosinus sp. Sm6 TaxID=2866948 RepID=UPI001C993A6C|nr:hypothetical protein [Methylosinus sp. Sm6]MBY6243273.1 hypothetical protein [Methylosinus sp. Sm6]